MPLLSKVVIVDTSCFILLDKINELELLKQLFRDVITTKEVAQEFGKSLPNWINIESPKDKKYQLLLELEVDKGEASAIALYSEIEEALLVLDDLKARKLAERLSLNYTGTLGMFARAKTEGVIASVKPIIKKIQKTNFRFSDEVFSAIIKTADEE